MANEEHLKILKQGAEAWNQWREKNPEITPDLSKADLIEADLTGAKLDRKAEIEYFDPDEHIIPFIRDTLTAYFSRAKKKAGIDKKGAVHILRHTAATKLFRISGMPRNSLDTKTSVQHKSIPM